MKTVFAAFILFFSLLFSLCATAYCGSCNAKPAYSHCDPRVSACQCTDPYCQSLDRTCMSRGRCCAAFGNAGALSDY